MHNPDNWPEEVGVIEKADFSDGYNAITFDGGWTCSISADELAAFVSAKDREPQVGDSMVCLGGFGRPVTGIIIDDVTLRYKTREQVEEERKNWLIEHEKKKIARYYDNINRWQAEVEVLHPTLKARIRRFEAEKGIYEFWKEDGGYEMYAMQGADALLKAAEFYHPGDTERQIQFLDDWWDINSAKHDYNYKLQMELVPAFGDGHSGNTAGAAKMFAKAILTGEYSE